jgi:hypothetical protein
MAQTASFSKNSFGSWCVVSNVLELRHHETRGVDDPNQSAWLFRSNRINTVKIRERADRS